MKINALMLSSLLMFSMGCNEVRESHRTVQPLRVTELKTYSAKKVPLVIGLFANKSSYLNGIFSDSKDRMGMQARQILKTNLSMAGCFTVLDRVNMEALSRESGLSGEKQNLGGGKIVITGAVTEFGRKETGTQALGGIFGKTKKQTAYGRVDLSVVDVSTSTVLYSAQGAGEYNLRNKEVLGFGSSASYDATLTDKVLNLAIVEAVNKLTAGLESGKWGMEN